MTPVTTTQRTRTITQYRLGLPDSKSLVQISEFATDDLDKAEPPSNDWDLLISPFVRALVTPNPDHRPDDTFVTATQRDYIFPYLRLRRSSIATIDLQTALAKKGPKTTELLETFQQQLTRGLPLVLLGEPGIGKSTWISRFARNSASHDVQCILYDHALQAGNLRPAPTTEARMSGVIRGLIIQKLIDLLAAYRACDTAVPELTADDELNWTSETVKKIVHGVRFLRAKGVRVMLLIDNLDRYSRAIQENAINIAVHCTHELKILTVVAIRPYSYREQEWKERVTPILMRPPDVRQALFRRLHLLQYERDNEYGLHALLVFLVSNQLSLSWLRTPIGHPYQLTPEAIRTALLRLYVIIAKRICANAPLLAMLLALRHYNIRKITEDIGRLIRTSFVEKNIRESIGTEPRRQAGRTGEYELITAYLRGPYRRHRGGRQLDHVINVANVFDVGSKPESPLVAVRVLQLIKVRSTAEAITLSIDDISYGEILTAMHELGYAEDDIWLAIRFLAIRRVIIETSHHYDFGQVDHQDPSDIRKTYTFALSASGQYFFRCFFQKESFRYLDAMSDVTRLPKDLFSTSKISGKNDTIDISVKVFMMLRCIYGSIMDERGKRLGKLDSSSESRWEILLRKLYTESFVYTLTMSVATHMSQINVRMPPYLEPEWKDFLANIDQLNDERLTIVNGAS